VIEIFCAGLLFDMDGVLVSSIASARRCWRAWGKHYNVPGWETLEIPHGVRAIEIVQRFKPDIDPQAGLKLIEDMEVEDTNDIVLLAGAKSLLESLPKERWTIVTSASRRLLLARLKAAGLPVPADLVSAESVIKGKPDPEPYRLGAERLGLPVAKCVVVEDAPSGIKAGIAAGCQVIGVIGTHEASLLHEAGATWVVQSLEKVTANIDANGLRLRLEVI